MPLTSIKLFQNLARYPNRGSRKNFKSERLIFLFYKILKLQKKLLIHTNIDSRDMTFSLEPHLDPLLGNLEQISSAFFEFYDF